MSKNKPQLPVGKRPAHERNPVAHSTIMRKGGVHQSSNKAGRQKDKQHLMKQLRERSDRSPYPAAA